MLTLVCTRKFPKQYSEPSIFFDRWLLEGYETQ